MNVKIMFFLFWLFMPALVSGQHILALEKAGSGKLYLYQLGDQISLKRHGDTARLTGTLTSVSDSGFILDMTYKIGFGDVKYIFRRFPHRKQQGTTLIIAGGALLAITSVNNLSHCKPVIDPLFLGISAGIASLGILWKSLSWQRYQIGLRWKLKELDMQYLWKGGVNGLRNDVVHNPVWLYQTDPYPDYGKLFR